MCVCVCVCVFSPNSYVYCLHIGWQKEVSKFRTTYDFCVSCSIVLPSRQEYALKLDT